jgi:hypothetical protein
MSSAECQHNAASGLFHSITDHQRWRNRIYRYYTTYIALGRGNQDNTKVSPGHRRGLLRLADAPSWNSNTTDHWLSLTAVHRAVRCCRIGVRAPHHRQSYVVLRSRTQQVSTIRSTFRIVTLGTGLDFDWTGWFLIYIANNNTDGSSTAPYVVKWLPGQVNLPWTPYGPAVYLQQPDGTVIVGSWSSRSEGGYRTAGHSGDQGPQGIQGVPGPQGDKGTKGDTADIGPQGIDRGTEDHKGVPEGPRADRGA